MRVGILAYALDRNNTGISQYIRKLINNLKKNHDLTIVHLRKSGDPVYAGTREVLIPRLFHSSPLIRLYMNFALRNPNVDVLYHPGPIGYLIKPNVPFVQSMHDMTPLKIPESQNLLSRWGYRLLMKAYARTADGLLTLSESSKNDVCSMLNISRSRVYVTPLASIYRMPKRSEAQRVKKKYKLANPYFIFVGTRMVHKNLVRMLEGFVQSGSQNHFVLVGAEGYRSWEIHAAVRRLKIADKVHFLDNVPNSDLPGLYASADALVFVSLSEGFGLPVIEAMSCGCPVIASRISSIPEVAGDAALYVDPYNVDDIAQAMRVVGRKRAFLIRKGFRQARKFSWKKTAEQTSRVFRLLVKGKS